LKEDDPKFADWLNIAKSPKLNDFIVYHSDPTSSQSEGTISLYIEITAPLTYTGSFDVESIGTWVTAEGYPLVVALDQQSWTRADKSGTPLVTVFF